MQFENYFDITGKIWLTHVTTLKDCMKTAFKSLECKVSYLTLTKTILRKREVNSRQQDVCFGGQISYLNSVEQGVKSSTNNELESKNTVTIQFEL